VTVCFVDRWSTIPPISTKQSLLNSDGQQFYQYQQNNRL
jgi:hypothetical protein